MNPNYWREAPFVVSPDDRTKEENTYTILVHTDGAWHTYNEVHYQADLLPIVSRLVEQGYRIQVVTS